ncbi:MAG TPA: hypothetical protein PLV51_09105, partial [Lentimicrobium sp.]|nr:hypothetical protein [Lentimicrobium sp.]
PYTDNLSFFVAGTRIELVSASGGYESDAIVLIRYLLSDLFAGLRTFQQSFSLNCRAFIGKIIKVYNLPRAKSKCPSFCSLCIVGFKPFNQI